MIARIWNWLKTFFADPPCPNCAPDQMCEECQWWKAIK